MNAARRSLDLILLEATTYSLLRIACCFGKARPGSPGKTLQLLVELACRAGDVHSARNVALAVLHALHHARRLAALGAVCTLAGIHYLLAICGLCDFRHSISS